jgi:hypothetical protein
MSSIWTDYEEQISAEERLHISRPPNGCCALAMRMAGFELRNELIIGWPGFALLFRMATFSHSWVKSLEDVPILDVDYKVAMPEFGPCVRLQ